MESLSKIYTITDNVHGTIQLSQLEKDITSTPLFNRLHRILQSSLVYLTFPSNKTKRYEHSIGTMHLSGKIFYHSLMNSNNSDREKFFTVADDEISKWINKECSSTACPYLGDEAIQLGGLLEKHDAIHDFDSGLYNRCLPGNIEKKYRFTYIVFFQALRLAALLHDVGHLPYSHVVERAIDDLYLYNKKCLTGKKKPTDRMKRFNKLLEPMKKNKIALHEALGKRVADVLFDNYERELTTELIWDDLSIPEKNNLMIVAVVINFTKKILCSSAAEDTIFSNLHTIFAGTIDADRLDYCCRDNRACGIDNGIINYERIFNSYVMMQREKKITTKRNNKTEFVFCIASKNYKVADDLIYRRWRIFTDINYHHKVHKYEVLMTRCIFYLGKEYLDSSEKEEEPENRDILSIDIHGIWDIINEIYQNKANRKLEQKLIQFDDSWLDTMLKVAYLNKKFEQNQDAPSQITYNASPQLSKKESFMIISQLEELISAREIFFSVVKREHDIEQIYRYTLEGFISSSKWTKVTRLLRRMTKMPNTFAFNINLVSNCVFMLNDIFKKGIDTKKVDAESLFVNVGTAIRLLDSFPDGIEDFVSYLEEELEKNLPKVDPNIDGVLVDYIYRFLKSGIDNANSPILLWKYKISGISDFIDEKRDYVELKDLSCVEAKINEEKQYFPPLYIYVRKKNRGRRLDIPSYYETIGLSIARSILTILETNLDCYMAKPGMPPNPAA